MRPITKILLVILAVIVAYGLWPRDPSIGAGVKIPGLAQTQVESWEALRKKDSVGVFVATYKMMDLNYRFIPLAALMMGQCDWRAMVLLNRYTEEPDVDKALAPIQEKYVIFRRDLGAEFNSDHLARNQFRQFRELPGTLSRKALTDLFAAEWSIMYGRSLTNVLPAAAKKAAAFETLIAGDREAAVVGMTESLVLLFEILEKPEPREIKPVAKPTPKPTPSASPMITPQGKLTPSPSPSVSASLDSPAGSTAVSATPVPTATPLSKPSTSPTPVLPPVAPLPSPEDE